MGIREGAPVPTPARVPELVLAREQDEAVLAERVRAKQLVRVGRGAYLPQGEWTKREVSLARIAAMHAHLGAEHWFSHESAAMLWGLPVWKEPQCVHVRTTTAGSKTAGLSRHRGELPPGTTTHLHDLPVTTLPLTVVDCARTLPALPGLVVADAALSTRMSRDDAAQLLTTCRGKGVRRAATVLRYADGGAESPWETATRLVLLRAGLPAPVTQFRLSTRIGPVHADLAIVDWHLLIEFDGRLKYTGPQVVYDEKLRNDAITEQGGHLLHITASDHTDTEDLVDRVLAYAPPGFRLTPRPHLLF
ncbi:MAG: hypothetical protein FWF02_11665 [Micrococcales bacterium]|nr:hypothetical protein [Micrococcales bacterium]MCL2668343.1 hypothetical protein [Micrococcales bacterium]